MPMRPSEIAMSDVETREDRKKERHQAQQQPSSHENEADPDPLTVLSRSLDLYAVDGFHVRGDDVDLVPSRGISYEPLVSEQQGSMAMTQLLGKTPLQLNSYLQPLLWQGPDPHLFEV